MNGYVRIRSVLERFDDKIELNRRMNETLEATARALFKSWFVDFDPVRAKLDGRQPHGMDADTAALFPDSFGDRLPDERHLPSGWRFEPLGDHVDAVRGLSYKGKYLADGEGVILHNLNSVREGGGLKVGGEKWYTGDYKPKHLAAPGDVFVANTEQGFDRLLIGFAALVPTGQTSEAIFSHHLYRVRPTDDSPLEPVYLFEMFNSRLVHDVVSGYANGTTVNMLPIDGLEMPRVVVPPQAITSVFARRVQQMLSLVESNILESRSLTELRDALLPKLLSGELAVPEAEEIVEDIA